jgi:hypothetical protein
MFREKDGRLQFDFARMYRALDFCALAVLVLFAMLLMAGCGDATVPVGPDPLASPAAPQQKVVSLALTVRDSAGALSVQMVPDELFTFETAPRCAIVDQACPRPSRVRWAVSGAFCEILGDSVAPSVRVLCAGFGVTRVDAIDLDSGATGQANVLVRAN